WRSRRLYSWRPFSAGYRPRATAADPHRDQDAGQHARANHLRGVDEDIDPADRELAADPAGGRTNRQAQNRAQKTLQPAGSDSAGGKTEPDTREHRKHFVHNASSNSGTQDFSRAESITGEERRGQRLADLTHWLEARAARTSEGRNGTRVRRPCGPRRTPGDSD